MLSPDLFAPFLERLNGLAIPYVVTGSAAAIAYGEPRMTHDIDLVVALTVGDVPGFVAAFPLEEFYCPPEEVLVIEVKRGQRGHANLIHHASGFKADVYIAFDELHRWALAHRVVVRLGEIDVPIAPVEYVIVRKLEYFREGGSQKHLRDIRGMLEVSGDRVDRTVVESWVGKLGLAEAWAAATTAA